MIDRRKLAGAIVRRVSARTFTGAPLAAQAETAVRDVAAMCPPQVRMVLLSGVNGKVGTYGVVSKSTAAIALVGDGSASSLFAAGRFGELAVLALTALGAATCWLGATYAMGEVAAKAGVLPGEKVIAVIVAGYAAEKPSMRDRLLRTLAHSRRRRTFGELFDADADSAEGHALELVRLAPSARNLQPWRAVARQGRVDFHMVDTGRFAMLDMGIAATHFDLGMGGVEFFIAADAEPVAGARYLFSATPAMESTTSI